MTVGRVKLLSTGASLRAVAVACLVAAMCASSSCSGFSDQRPEEANRRVAELQADAGRWLLNWPDVRVVDRQAQPCLDSTAPTLSLTLAEAHPGGHALEQLPARLSADRWDVAGSIDALRGTRRMTTSRVALLSSDRAAEGVLDVVLTNGDQVCGS